MRRKRIILGMLAALLTVMLQGCVKNEFRIEFKLSPDIDSQYTLVYYASDKKKGWYTEEVAPVEKGHYESRGYTRNPTLVYVSSAFGQGPRLIFYAERGDHIEITGGVDPMEWSVGGNKINEKWTEWRLANLKALRGTPEEVNAAVAAYLRKNPDDELSVLLLLTTYDRRADQTGFARLWNSIDEDTRDPQLVSLAGAPDRMSAAEQTVPARVSPLKLHAEGDSLVDYNPAAHKKTLLAFWRPYDTGHDRLVDSLRALASAGVRAGIVDICFEQNAYIWKERIRSDSLAGSLRAWMPGAETTEAAIALGVTRTPWIIVADNKGKIIYRGDDISRAAALIRKN